MRRLAALLATWLSALLLVLLCHLAGIQTRLELYTRDARILSGAGRKAPGGDVVIVWIDQESIDYMRRNRVSFPWPRSVYRDAAQFVRAGGARAVAFDILFDGPANADDDRELASWLAETPGDVLAFKFVAFRDGGFDDGETARAARRGLQGLSLPAAPVARGLVLPIPEFETAAEQLGFVNIRPDADKVFRCVDLLRTWRGRAYPSLALATAMVATGVNAPRVGYGRLHLGSGSVPILPGGEMAVSFRGPEFTFDRVKMVNLLESVLDQEAGRPPRVAPARFKDKVVLFGINADGYEDAHPTPLSPVFPGTELIATAIDNLLAGDALEEPDAEPWASALAGAGAAAAVFLLPGVVLPALVVTLLVVALAGLSLFLFAQGLLLPTAGPLLALLFAAAGAFLWRLLTEGRQKRELKRAFQSYMAPEVVQEILATPGGVRLGGHRRQVAVYFSDLAGFTSLAEQIPPEDLVSFLNDYFTRMCDRIMAERGVIDKFIGDAIMALFGAPLDQPDHSLRAVRAALSDLQEMDRINEELRARNRPAVKMRIGIHAGPAVVGNMGSSRRFDYTAIGDTVNLASRLEGANKRFGTYCMVSAPAWEGARVEVDGREIGSIRVVGRGAPMAVFEPWGLRGQLSAVDRAYLDRYNAALEAFRHGDRNAALAMLEDARTQRPGDPVIKEWLESLARPDWDGVFSLESK